ncbi:hypothetical protein ACFQ7F_16565 [Streptomyces sp. NPDC056486]|uniref:hypothetical protein n=1 Tax=Streptomyces sp. NPDC056486 TaxID=3345835 RepID=UPI0036802673
MEEDDGGAGAVTGPLGAVDAHGQVGSSCGAEDGSLLDRPHGRRGLTRSGGRGEDAAGLDRVGDGAAEVGEGGAQRVDEGPRARGEAIAARAGPHHPDS